MPVRLIAARIASAAAAAAAVVALGLGRHRARSRVRLRARAVRRAHPHRVLGREMPERVEERLHARDHAHAAKVLVALDGQVGLVAHLLGKELVDHGVWPAAVVGEIDRKETWVSPHELGSRNDVLPKRPTDARVVGRDVDVVAAVKVREVDDLLAVIEQDVGDAHVERAVGDAVVARDDDEHALIGADGGHELVSHALHLLAELRYGEAARHHGDGGFLRSVAQLRAQAEHGARHGLLAEVHVEHRVQKLNAELLKAQVVGDQPWRRLHIDASVVVRHV